MGKNFFKQKEKPKLYKKFLEDQREQYIETEGVTEKLPDQKAVKPIIPKKEKTFKLKSYLEDGIPVTIVIGSLHNHTGCSHLCMALKTYLDNLNYKTYLVHKENYNFNDMQNANFIIVDIGKLDDLSQNILNEVARANIKILVCLSTEIYLKELANFISSTPGSIHWKYFFNYVPEREYKKIYDLMEDYDSFILPIFNADEMDCEKTVKKYFKTILRGRK